MTARSGSQGVFAACPFFDSETPMGGGGGHPRSWEKLQFRSQLVWASFFVYSPVVRLNFHNKSMHSHFFNRVEAPGDDVFPSQHHQTDVTDSVPPSDR